MQSKDIREISEKQGDQLPDAPVSESAPQQTLSLWIAVSSTTYIPLLAS